MTRALSIITDVATYLCNTVLGVTYTLKGVGRCSTLLGDIDAADALTAIRAILRPPAQGLGLSREEYVSDDGWITTEQMRGARAWLALLVGICPQYGFNRDFIDPCEENLSRSGRGSKEWSTEEIGPGIYEASSTWRSMVAHRTFFKVDADLQIEILTRSEVKALFSTCA